MEQITNYIQPELLVLIPALYFIGVGLKKTAVTDRFIPLVLGAAGVGLGLSLCVGGKSADRLAERIHGTFHCRYTRHFMCRCKCVLQSDLQTADKQK